MRKDFYVTLPSNCTIGVFPDNATSHYTTPLHRRIDLRCGYEVGVTEIHYPTLIENVSSGNKEITIRTVGPDVLKITLSDAQKEALTNRLGPLGNHSGRLFVPTGGVDRCPVDVVHYSAHSIFKILTEEQREAKNIKSVLDLKPILHRTQGRSRKRSQESHFRCSGRSQARARVWPKPKFLRCDACDSQSAFSYPLLGDSFIRLHPFINKVVHSEFHSLSVTHNIQIFAPLIERSWRFLENAASALAGLRTYLDVLALDETCLGLQGANSCLSKCLAVFSHRENYYHLLSFSIIPHLTYIQPVSDFLRL